MRDQDDDLTFIIGYAIWRALRKRTPIEDCRLVAAAVVQHLELCGWRLVKKAPTKDHN